MVNSMFNILIVDDHESIRNLIGEVLKREGYHTFTAQNGIEALDIIDNNIISLMIADIAMPNMDGFTLTKEVRTYDMNFPILMVTAKELIEDKKKAFEFGTDDYMVKPIDLDELVLRVGALLRRSKIANEKRIVVGNTTIDYDTLTVYFNNESILLPPKEFKLLFKLLSYPKKIFTRQDIMNDIWGYDSETDERTVDVHIKRLREKLNVIEDFNIITIRGLGYKVDIYEKTKD